VTFKCLGAPPPILYLTSVDKSLFKYILFPFSYSGFLGICVSSSSRTQHNLSSSPIELLVEEDTDC
jgi:hypothetical protein